MRRDVFIQNDSGGFSVLAADAVDAMIEDGRTDDMRFVTTHKALLLELYGDDSMPVRVVVDEPLSADEEAQWLARATWRIDTSDGRVLVMGGFDPDVLADWKENDQGGDSDSRSVAAVTAKPGSWRVDVYAHAGSMNGRQILSESGTAPGAAFRRSHPDRAIPLWLAEMLSLSGEEDPGFEAAWSDVAASMADGTLAIDTESGDAIGFLVHITRDERPVDETPEGGWFARDANARVPEVFPLGLASDAPDPNLRSFRDSLLGEDESAAPPQTATGRLIDVIETWSGDPLKTIDGGAVSLDLSEAYLLYWITAMTCDSPPRFELWVEPKGAWSPPATTLDVVVVSKGNGITAMGPPHDASGWQLWFEARLVALTGIPEGSTVTFAMAPRNEPPNPAIGRALYAGTVAGVALHVGEASPTLSRDILDQALACARDAAMNGRVTVRGAAERAAFDAAVEAYVFEEDSVKWKADVATLAEPDERTILMLASAVFRVRFAAHWAMGSSA
jgi:hypothetical protein